MSVAEDDEVGGIGLGQDGEGVEQGWVVFLLIEASHSYQGRGFGVVV